MQSIIFGEKSSSLHAFLSFGPESMKVEVKFIKLYFSNDVLGYLLKKVNLTAEQTRHNLSKILYPDAWIKNSYTYYSTLANLQAHHWKPAYA
jgi:hypothetical protein